MKNFFWKIAFKKQKTAIFDRLMKPKNVEFWNISEEGERTYPHNVQLYTNYRTSRNLVEFHEWTVLVDDILNGEQSYVWRVATS